MAKEDEEYTIDMTQARVLEPLDPKRPYLFAISAWKPGKSAGGGRKLHVEATVVEPAEMAGRKVFDDPSLDNEFTLGRVLTLLKALGYAEDEVKVKKFKIPAEDEVIGNQFTGWVRTRASETYGDRSQLTRMRPASAYKEVAT